MGMDVKAAATASQIGRGSEPAKQIEGKLKGLLVPRLMPETDWRGSCRFNFKIVYVNGAHREE